MSTNTRDEALRLALAEYNRAYVAVIEGKEVPATNEAAHTHAMRKVVAALAAPVAEREPVGGTGEPVAKVAKRADGSHFVLWHADPPPSGAALYTAPPSAAAGREDAINELVEAARAAVPLAREAVPGVAHCGPCGPESACDASCMDAYYSGQIVGRLDLALRPFDAARASTPEADR